MSWYLGPVGNLQAIEAPETFSADHSLPGGLHQTLSGARVRDRVGSAKRSFSMSWTALTADQFGVIRGLALGVYGPGPFVLVDPAERNLLTANQSSGTDVLRATTGFVSGALTSSALFPARGVRSLALALGITGTGVRFYTGSNASLTVADASDVPALPAVSYTGQVLARRSSVPDVAVSVQLRLYFFDAAGAAIGSPTLGTAVALSFVHQAVTVTATAPALTAYARLAISNSTATAAISDLYFDDWQLEQAAAASAWVPGMGVPRVSFDGIPVSYPAIPYYDVSANLTEI